MPRRLRRPLPLGALFALALAMISGLLELACSPGREERIDDVLQRSRAASEKVIDLETPFLKDPEPDVRALAVWAIGDAEVPGAEDVLAPLVNDPAPSVTLSLARALCRATGDKALAVLVTLGSNPDDATRRVAIRCLASAAAPAQETLSRALLDKDRQIRGIALSFFSAHPDPQALANLLTLLSAKERDEQLGAIAAIRAQRDPRALPDLENAAASHLSPSVRDSVEAAILDLRSLPAPARESPAPPEGKGAEDGTSSPSSQP